MKDLIEKLVADYKADRITWHDIQDIVEAQLIMQAGGVKEYDKIPIRQRIDNENVILEKIEKGIGGESNEKSTC
jgi:predicted RNase H-like nuclease